MKNKSISIEFMQPVSLRSNQKNDVWKQCWKSLIAHPEGKVACRWPMVSIAGSEESDGGGRELRLSTERMALCALTKR